MSNTFTILLTPIHKGTILLASLLILFTASCINKKSNTEKIETRIITDMNKRLVEIPIKIDKIIAHRAGALRLVCYLDATDKIIGVESNEKRRSVPYLFAYPELRKLPIIGSGNNSDPELIALLQPDVLICTYLNSGEADDLQRKTGIPVACLNYGDFNEKKDDFYNSLRLLGNIVEKEKRAEFLINYIEGSFNQIINTCKKAASKESVYIGGIAFRGSHGINSTEPKYAAFRFTNTKNLSSTLIENSSSSFTKLSSCVIDKEQIIKWNPDKIFIDASGFTLSQADLEKTSILGKMLSAVQKDEVYLLFPHIWHTINYEHILINTYYIARVLHPELYPDMDIKEKANEVYTNFLGKAIYDDMIVLYGKACQKLNENE